MDAFNHSNPFESHVIYVRDYRNDHIRLFTIKQADFDTIKLPLHLTSDMLASVIAEFVSKTTKGKLNTKESDTLAPETVLTTQEVLVFSSQVKNMDVSNHPEWFRGRR
nr:hypothetical protein [Photorhabdus heterorhabditis]